MLKRPEVRAYLQKIREDNAKITKKMVERYLQRAFKELEKSVLTERRITKYDEKEGISKTIVKKAIAPRDIVELTKVAGLYNPTLTVKHTSSESENEKKVCEDLIKKIKESEA